MAGDNWENWARDPHKIRVARRFRHHIRTLRNRKGRIRREPCAVCTEAGEHSSAARSEAHHVDYAQPFLVVWVCPSHHRKIDHGSLRVKMKWLWDYSSLVRVKRGTWIDTPF